MTDTWTELRDRVVAHYQGSYAVYTWLPRRPGLAREPDTLILEQLDRSGTENLRARVRANARKQPARGAVVELVLDRTHHNWFLSTDRREGRAGHAPLVLPPELVWDLPAPAPLHLQPWDEARHGVHPLSERPPTTEELTQALVMLSGFVPLTDEDAGKAPVRVGGGVAREEDHPLAPLVVTASRVRHALDLSTAGRPGDPEADDAGETEPSPYFRPRDPTCQLCPRVAHHYADPATCQQQLLEEARARLRPLNPDSEPKTLEVRVGPAGPTGLYPVTLPPLALRALRDVDQVARLRLKTLDLGSLPRLHPLVLQEVAYLAHLEELILPLTVPLPCAVPVGEQHLSPDLPSWLQRRDGAALALFGHCLVAAYYDTAAAERARLPICTLRTVALQAPTTLEAVVREGGTPMETLCADVTRFVLEVAALPSLQHLLFPFALVDEATHQRLQTRYQRMDPESDVYLRQPSA